MSFQVTNISQNALLLSDGKMIASGDKRNFDAISKTEKDFQTRGWLQIIEEQPKEEPAAAAQQTQSAAEATAKTTTTDVKTTEGVNKTK